MYITTCCLQKALSDTLSPQAQNTYYYFDSRAKAEGNHTLLSHQPYPTQDACFSSKRQPVPGTALPAGGWGRGAGTRLDQPHPPVAEEKRAGKAEDAKPEDRWVTQNVRAHHSNPLPSTRPNLLPQLISSPGKSGPLQTPGVRQDRAGHHHRARRSHPCFGAGGGRDTEHSLGNLGPEVPGSGSQGGRQKSQR